MRISYRTLASLIEKMSEVQKDVCVTVEDGYEGETYTADLRVAGSDHDELDEGHPVIYFGNSTCLDGIELVDTVEEIAKYIGLRDHDSLNLTD